MVQRGFKELSFTEFKYAINNLKLEKLVALME